MAFMSGVIVGMVVGVIWKDTLEAFFTKVLSKVIKIKS